MGFHFPEDLMKLWNSWNIRTVILLSLSLQTILILFAPLRKSTANKHVIFLIWAAYLLADWAASFCVGLISDNQRNPKQPGNPNKQPHEEEHGDLLAFWAPFLLLHLGGPDTITAFSLEDNALWLRHLTALIFQAVSTSYVFLQTLPTNKLWIPTLLMFVNGITKYAERTRSLFLASLDRFRDSMLKEPDPGPNYAKLMEEYASKKEADLPTEITMIPERVDTETPVAAALPNRHLDDLQVVLYAHHYFQIFKGLLVDIIFSFKERKESRDFFNTLSASNALRIMEVELNFLYEALFTKMVVVHSKWGFFFRFVSFSSVMASLAVFRFHVRKHGKYPPTDLRVTYTLLAGAICLDLIAFAMIIFSDWTIASIFKRPGYDSEPRKKSSGEIFYTKLLQLKSYSLYGTNNKKGLPVFRRWSGSISGYNMITYCLKSNPNKSEDHKKWFSCWHLMIHKLEDQVIDTFGLKDFVDELIYTTSTQLTDDLWEFIFDELQQKSYYADDPEIAMRICSSRGEWVLQHHDSSKYEPENQGDSSDDRAHNIEKVLSELLHYIIQVTYDESLVTWHIATELCYRSENDHNVADTGSGDGKSDLKREDEKNKKEYSKVLSDYMLYLLIMQSNMMSTVAGIGKIRFRDTCAEAERFFSRRDFTQDEKTACAKILEVNTDVKPVDVKGDRSKSVLFDASMLAKLLMQLPEKWDIISKVWVELMSYAASHCIASSHGQSISKGGELVTFVWLLMAHFGIGEQFQINEGHARAKLIVGK